MTLKLTRLGEQTDEYVLTRTLMGIFGDSVEIFIPYNSPRTDYSKRICVLEGYVFIRTNLEKFKVVALNKSYYFERLNESFAYVDASHVLELKEKLQAMCEEHFSEGEYVLITDGPYEKLDGEILEVKDDHVIVLVSVRSRIMIAPIPKVSVIRYCP